MYKILASFIIFIFCATVMTPPNINSGPVNLAKVESNQVILKEGDGGSAPATFFDAAFGCEFDTPELIFYSSSLVSTIALANNQYLHQYRSKSKANPPQAPPYFA